MVASAKKEGGLTLYASNVICTRISPVTGSFSYGSSLREREMSGLRVRACTGGTSEVLSKFLHRGVKLGNQLVQLSGYTREHALVPLINRMVMYQHRLDLYGAQET